MEVYIVKLNSKVANHLAIKEPIIGCFTTLEKAEEAINEIRKIYKTSLHITDYQFIKTTIDVNRLVQLKPQKQIEILEPTKKNLIKIENYRPTIKKEKDIEYVYCPKRQKFYVHEKEVQVTQIFLHFLMTHFQYPIEQIELEYRLKDMNGKDKRIDILVSDTEGKPLIVVECKNTDIELSQKVFDQAKNYNNVLKAKYIVVANHIYYDVRFFDEEDKMYKVTFEIPKFSN